MNILRIVLLALLAAPHFSNTRGAEPAPSLAKRYSGPLTYEGWAGYVEFASSATNYLLTAASSTNSQNVLSVASLKPGGFVDWGGSLFYGPRGQPTIRALPGSDLIQIRLEGLPNEDFWSVFGVFNGRTGQRVFERGVPAIIDLQEPGPVYLPQPVTKIDDPAE